MLMMPEETHLHLALAGDRVIYTRLPSENSADLNLGYSIGVPLLHVAMLLAKIALIFLLTTMAKT